MSTLKLDGPTPILNLKFEITISSDGSITVHDTNGVKNQIDEKDQAILDAVGDSRLAMLIADRLDRYEKYDPTTLARQTFQNMTASGYKAAEISADSTTTYIRMIYVAGSKTSILYLDSAGLVSDNASQAAFAMALPFDKTSASGNRVRFSFALGQKDMDAVWRAFKDGADDSLF